ncbi:MAG: alkaline serine protease [Conexibacter sp.]|nr:alkaline serine protease [Conexibacter sp.]
MVDVRGLRWALAGAALWVLATGPVPPASAHADCAGDASCPLPNDPLVRKQWYLQNDAHTIAPSATPAPVFGADIDAPLGWQRGMGSGAVKIAIVDSGVDVHQPDLAGRIVSTMSVAGDGDATDHVGHGTFVAGIAGAGWGNGIGIAGVDPSAALIIVKDTDQTSDSAIPAATLAAGIVAAVDAGAQVINTSQAGHGFTSVIHDAVDYAWSHGALVVAAAGNSGSSTPEYPAAEPNAISVGATDIAGRRASFSNYGSWVSVTAPGQDILSTQPTYATTYFGAPAGDPAVTAYAYSSGTSFAAPMVAAIAATVWPTVTDLNHNGRVNDEVAARILGTTDPDRTAGSSRYGAADLCHALAANRTGVCPGNGPPDPALMTPTFPPAAGAGGAPSTPTAPAAPAPAPAKTRRGLPVPKGSWTARIRTKPTTRLRLTVGAAGRTLTRATATLRLTCAHRRHQTVRLSILSRRDQLPLSPAGAFDTTIKAPATPALRRVRFHLTGQLLRTHHASGTISGAAIDRRHGGTCRTGTLRWATG